MYVLAVYRNTLSMGPFYVENFYRWVKMAVWDAPKRVYLDIQLEKMKIERECLSEAVGVKNTSD